MFNRRNKFVRSVVLVALSGILNVACQGGGPLPVSTETVTKAHTVEPALPPAPAYRRVLLVVRGEALNAADTALRSRLEQTLGYEVTVIAGPRVTGADAAAYGLVVVSESTESRDVGIRLTDSRVPMVVMEPALFPFLKMTGPVWQSDFGDTQNQVAIDIVLPEHPLAAGQSRRVTVATTAGKLVWGKADKSTTVAHIAGQPGQAAVFVYEAGAEMVGLKAPGRRVGWFAGRDIAASFTDSAWRLFDEAIRWAAKPRALLVTGASRTASDNVLVGRLGRLGFLVDVRKGSDARMQDADGVDLVVISESVDSLQVGGRFRTTRKPLLVNEPALFDDLGMTGLVWQRDFGDIDGATQIEIRNATHPLAADLVGKPTVARGPSKLVWGRPSASATTVATIVGQNDQAALFAYGSGAEMVGLKAPGIRVGFFAGRDLAANMTDEGLQLFDRAVSWASGRSRIRKSGATQLPPGARLLANLAAISDPEQRKLVAFFALNELALIKRALAGVVPTPNEQELSAYVASASPAIRAALAKHVRALDDLTPAQRQQVLGDLAMLEPGDPVRRLPPILVQAEENAARVPRLRTNACTGGLAYDGDKDPAIAARATTVAGSVVDRCSDGCFLARSTSRPTVSGIVRSNAVGGHSSLKTDRELNRDCGELGDGLSPYGVLTNIPCSQTSPCDKESGLICGAEIQQDAGATIGSFTGNRCYAFPVVTPGQDLVLRGHNFWDTRDTQLAFTDLNESAPPALVPLQSGGVIANETSDPILNCQSPLGRGMPGAACRSAADGGRLTHNTARFLVPEGLGGRFFRLKMMNHNGRFPGGQLGEGGYRHHRNPEEPGRVIHTCYANDPNDPDRGLEFSSAESIQALTYPSDFARHDCAVPTQSCVSNENQVGACGSDAWSPRAGQRPRSLAECRHPAGSPPVCGETPEWIYSEPEEVAGGLREPFVFVTAQQQSGFKLVGRLHGVRCFEETGPDWAGSDELRVVMTSVPEILPGVKPVQISSRVFDRDGFNSTGGTARTPDDVKPPRTLALAGSLPIDAAVVFSTSLFERDACEDDDFACRAFVAVAGVAIAAVAVVAIALACPPCAAAIGSQAGVIVAGLVTAALVAILYNDSTMDRIGSESFIGTPADFGERATISHLSGFSGQVEGEGGVGPLRRAFLGTDRGNFRNVLSLPNQLALPPSRFSGVRFNPLETSSESGKLVGFRENRRIEGGGGDYGLSLLWQRITCGSIAECQGPENANPAQP